MVEKRIFDWTNETIKYHWPIRPATFTKSIFFQLVGLSPLIASFIDLNCIKSKNYSRNDNISDQVDIGDRVDISNEVDNKIPWADRLLPNDSNRTKSESPSNHCNIYNMIGQKISFMKEIQTNHSNSNHFKSECLNNNTVNRNRNIGNRFCNKKLQLEDFEDPQQIDLFFSIQSCIYQDLLLLFIYLKP